MACHGLVCFLTDACCECMSGAKTESRPNEDYINLAKEEIAKGGKIIVTEIIDVVEIRIQFGSDKSFYVDPETARQLVPSWQRNAI